MPMSQRVVEHFIKVAHENDTAVSAIVKKATEAGMIVPSILTAALEAAGYAVNYMASPNGGAKVLITKDEATAYDEENPNIVARSVSGDKAEALLRAVYSWLHEEAKISPGKEVPVVTTK